MVEKVVILQRAHGGHIDDTVLPCKGRLCITLQTATASRKEQSTARVQMVHHPLHFEGL
jgi:hypothetical protein